MQCTLVYKFGQVAISNYYFSQIEKRDMGKGILSLYRDNLSSHGIGVG